MRRAAAWVCVVAATAAGAMCGFASWPLSPARVGDSLNAAYGASSRLRWRAPDAVAFAALPWPRLNVVDARLDAGFGDTRVSAPPPRLDLPAGARIRARVDPAP